MTRQTTYHLLAVVTGALLGLAIYSKDTLIREYLFTDQAIANALRRDVPRQERLLRTLFSHLAITNGSSVYNMAVVNRYKQTIDAYLGSIDGLTILEIGPGRNLSVGAIYVLAGAQRYYGLDIYKDPNFDDLEPLKSMIELSRLQRGLLQHPVESVLRHQGRSLELDREKVVFLYPHLSSDIPLPNNAIDFVFTNSAFEHFLTPRETIAAIYRVLKPGGITAHKIDLRDHRDSQNPLAFLKMDATEWRSLFPDEIIWAYTNRWRSSDFKTAFAATGFELLEFDQRPGRSDFARAPWFDVPLTEADRNSFHPDFHRYSLDDLSRTFLFIVCRKPVGAR
jgi:SAM-dependent methyltransferase